MKINILLIIFCLSYIKGSGQNVATKAIESHNVSRLSIIKWDNQIGIPYKQVPGVNLGATSFQVLGDTQTAILSDASNEIVVINNSGGILTRFPVSIGPRDFVFENDMFYILEERQITLYDKTGKSIKHFPLSPEYASAVRIFRFGNSTYLALPSGNSIKIESRGNAIKSNEQEGWVTSSGNYVLTKLGGGNTYYVKIITPNGSVFDKYFTSDKKVAGIFVVGCTSNRLILDLQTFISENPVSVERFVVSITLSKAGIGKAISKKIPDCYYVLSNKDLDVSSNGSVLNMITSPQGVHIFSLTETKSIKRTDYPPFLREIKYHFNNHLLPVD